MAFGGRGGGGSGGIRFRTRPYRRYYNNYYCITDFIIIFLSILIFVFYSIYSYKTPFDDPILNLKDTFINIQIISTISLAILNIVLVSRLEDKRKLQIFLILLLILTILLISIQALWKIYLNSKYTQSTFSNLYETLDISDISQYTYIHENLIAYKNFTIKYYINLFFQFLLIILNIFFIFKTLQSVKKIEEREKNYAILFDEEINIKV